MGRAPPTNEPVSPGSASASSEETPLLQEYESLPSPPKPPKVSWASLPNKGQLSILVLARLAEPLSERSLTSYLFYQLKWFDPQLSAAEIAQQAGYLTAVFAAAQCLTSMWWGRAADNPRLGRKRVLMIGLVGSALSALGMGFSRSIAAAFFFRFCAGALNGNIGVLRTMVSEVVLDKRFRPRAFLLLPMCFNVGVIIGPLLSGFLADPTHNLPFLFENVQWLKKYPYALPNLMCSSILSLAAVGVMLGLDETHPQLLNRADAGRRLGKFVARKVLGRPASQDSYEPVPSHDLTAGRGAVDTEARATGTKPETKTQTPFKAILTKNVILCMLQRFLQSLHVSAFNSIFFTLLPTPRADSDDFHLPFSFSGGLGLSSKKMGFANTTIGMIGIPLQLIVYPRLIGSVGVRQSYRVFLPLSIVAYFSLPYLVLLPDNIGLIWTCLSMVLTMHVLSRTFVNPATMLLVNDCAPSPDVLGTVHGLASSISSGARILGPTVGGWLLGWGFAHNIVGLPLWCLGIVAVLNWTILWWIDDVKMEE